MQSIIKKPIYHTKYNITIFPNDYKNKIPIDITLKRRTIFWFKYRKKPNEMKLYLLREEVLSNLPKIKQNQNDLYVHIRSGDIFLTNIASGYSQPPLCFYQKIINDNKFDKIWLISNGFENPVIFKLLKLYSNVKFMQTTLELAISVIVNAYNLAIPRSTFSTTLISLNTNLKNLFVYKMFDFDLSYINSNIHIMKPSRKYNLIMKGKWKNTKEQLDLMISEKCINSSFITLNKLI